MNTQMKIFNFNMCRILLATCLSALCLVAVSTKAATITVTNTNDSGAGSLRQAIADAHNGDRIDFGVTGTITLGTDELRVDKSITISGPGSDNVTVAASGYSHVFHVSGGVSATIAGLTITNGDGEEEYLPGGGIYNDHSTLTVDKCTVTGNYSPGVGGGAYNDGSNGSATLTLTNSTFSNNRAARPTGYGEAGGIYNDGSYGSATLTVINSTFSNNNGNLAGPSRGGAIHNDAYFGSAALTINNSTFTNNSAYQGGAIYNGGGTVTIRNTILNDNMVGENLYNSSGSVSSLGYNLSDDNGSGFLTATGDQINTDPMLGLLQDNGGPTFTHALLTGSPAIDAGDPSFTPSFNYDQRCSGFQRVFNGRVDIGAFEVQPPAPSYVAQVQAPINPDGSSTFNVRRGVVPVKFNLTHGGVATCDLPPATIAVTRTAGGVIGQINESIYSGNADTGSNFRIDSCQYVYNLNSRALGVGTYRVDILIDGQVVGNAVFGLN
jgi:hypothetical protein